MGLDFTKIAVQCRLRAAEYKMKAERALLHSDRRYYGLMARQWFVIAEGYEAQVTGLRHHGIAIGRPHQPPVSRRPQFAHL